MGAENSPDVDTVEVRFRVLMENKARRGGGELVRIKGVGGKGE